MGEEGDAITAKKIDVIMDYSLAHTSWYQKSKYMKINNLMQKSLWKWCPGEDLNFHDLAATGTWSQRVYQFRHLGTEWIVTLVIRGA